ncbi:hypothetical protein [Rhizobium rhizogenes]|uniref:hypothetical protein n=1 Tax=Rhizobium rhizogenes TaxID=359 RepID=UPI00226DEBF9|nr:hypothetical protein [Rhizobium rhizogenes]
MSQAYWWLGRPGENYWLESTDREDIGTDLRAPELDGGDKENWRYLLLKNAVEGDLVFHYDSNQSAITSVSRVAGQWAPRQIIWAAHGTSARERGAVPTPVPGYFIPLEDHTTLDKPVTLAELRLKRPLLDEIHDRIPVDKGGSVYFPFELSGRPVRPLQGYGFKLPAELVRSFPAMDAAARLLLKFPEPDEIQAAVRQAVAAIEREAGPFEISKLQKMRARALGFGRTARTIFNSDLKGRDWAFHQGGRSELQFNVGYDRLANGVPAVRAGIAFSFQASRSFPKIDALLPKVARFNDWLRENADGLGDLQMWSWKKSGRSLNRRPAPIPEALFQEGNFVFLGMAQLLGKFDPLVALRVFDRLLPLYKAVEFAQSPTTCDQPTDASSPSEEETLQIEKGREAVGGRWINASTKDRTLDIYLRHAEIQRRLKEELVKEGFERVVCEVPIGLRSVDLVALKDGALWMFEIKTGMTVRSCLREALGQLLEYALWPGATKPTQLVVVGTPGLEGNAICYIEELNKAFPISVSYRQVSLD